MNSVLGELEKSIATFQDELLEDAEAFRASLKAFREVKTKRGSDEYYTLYGQMYANLTQLKHSAETVQAYMDQADDLADIIETLPKDKAA